MADPVHLYRVGLRGRSMSSQPGVGGTTIIAKVRCARCDAVGERRFGTVFPPDQMDRKFQQAGWRLDPNTCPNCVAEKAKEKTMATKPSPAAMQAQAKMFRLLEENFDTDKGCYAAGYSDEKVAKETGLAVDLVIEWRRGAFGEIKEPAEFRALRDDINALDNLAKENAANFAQEIAALRGRLADASKRWSA